ncbi:MAG: hypothetical protein NC433_01800 [Clostridiales bacterium]|nr:hypothetical protein [Clostridiales bacterium]
MLFFAIELDEERILKDGIINLAAAHKTIENTFAQRNVTLYHKEGTVRYYTRNIDDHDFEFLWMVNAPFRYESWFQYYVKQWRYIDIDDDTNEIYEEEDLMDGWVIRPEKP